MTYHQFNPLKFFTRILVLIISLSVQNSISESEFDILLGQGIEFYEKGDYNQAKDIFEKLIELNPEVSNYHHWLGKSYGRIAEKASWFKAMSMAKKTRKAFEKAVELNDKNVDALKDLMQYYQDAPGFLGGSKEKATAIQERLIKLDNNI